MQTERQNTAPEFIDARADEHDPFDVVPDGFCRDWNATSIPEALRNAEEAPSSTPRSETQRCPECRSVRVQSKHGSAEQEHQVDTRYKCDECSHHFDAPADAAPGRQVSLRDAVRTR